MSDSNKISVELIGKLLREVQAQQRTQSGDIAMVRKDIDRPRTQMTRFASRDEVLEVVPRLVDRIANLEALMESRFDLLDTRLANKSHE